MMIIMMFCVVLPSWVYVAEQEPDNKEVHGAVYPLVYSQKFQNLPSLSKRPPVSSAPGGPIIEQDGAFLSPVPARREHQPSQDSSDDDEVDKKIIGATERKQVSLRDIKLEESINIENMLRAYEQAGAQEGVTYEKDCKVILERLNGKADWLACFKSAFEKAQKRRKQLLQEQSAAILAELGRLDEFSASHQREKSCRECC